MIDLERLRVFYSVARHEGITPAAASLGVSQPAISRHISMLEERMKLPLFHRHARGLSLTEEGEILFEVVHNAFSQLIMTEAILSEQLEPQGSLKIACHPSFGSMWLAQNMDDFLKIYPKINVSILVLSEDEPIDLCIREADVAIRSFAPKKPGLVCVPFLTHCAKAYASAAYLDKFSTPEKLEDLQNHRLLTLSTSATHSENWILRAGVVGSDASHKPFLTIEHFYGLLQAVIQGIGIASLDPYSVSEHPELIEILPDELPAYAPQFQWHLIYPETLRHSRRISAFRNFLFKKVIASHPY